MSALLTEEQIQQFITDGFVRIDEAFTANLASQVRDVLWKDIPFDRANPATWTEPVVWLGMYTQQPFIDSANTPKLHAAFNQLAGPGNWIPCGSVGAFPVRFPCAKQANDNGKHVDAGFPGDDPANYFEWRVNIKSKGRALLMLMLYSDVGENDAPTVIYKKSHLDVARLLAPYADRGLSFTELAQQANNLPGRETAFATGKAGTVYLCHPFLVHAAQGHKGTEPKFMAQPPLLLRHELNIVDAGMHTPLEQAIRMALGR